VLTYDWTKNGGQVSSYSCCLNNSENWLSLVAMIEELLLILFACEGQQAVCLQ
jgi:hypothetical protein